MSQVESPATDIKAFATLAAAQAEFDAAQARARVLKAELAVITEKIAKHDPAPVDAMEDTRRILQGIFRPTGRVELGLLLDQQALLRRDIAALQSIDAKLSQAVCHARTDATRARVKHRDVADALRKVGKAAQQLAEANAQSQALVRQLMDEGWSNLANAEFSWQMQFVGPATGATVDEWLKAAEAFCGERLS